jgi:hypothetical protein
MEIFTTMQKCFTEHPDIYASLLEEQDKKEKIIEELNEDLNSTPNPSSSN